MDTRRLHIVGIRHHSPACARLVRLAIDTLRPRRVLIEGPADFNPRIGELLLEHQPPLAIFTYCQEPGLPTRSCWTPFCSFSPEWQALRHGAEKGAEVLFCDLPAWHGVFRGRRNLSSDHDGNEARDYAAALCRRCAVDDPDTLWDHLFEQPQPPATLAENLEKHFEYLRGQAAAGERDGPREAFMSQVAAWALAQDPAADVLLVCGGWHAPAIRQAVFELPAPPPGAPFPAVQSDLDPEAKHGAYLVPYSYARLDAFTGYEAGMPSPGFYEAVWREGPERAGEQVLAGLTAALRAKTACSTADLLAALLAAQGLARLRGHRALSRTDLLDGLSAALIKEAQTVPAPWAEAWGLGPQTDPVHGILLQALRGDGRGRLAAGTPQPGLVPATLAELAAEGFLPARREMVELRLVDSEGRRRSRLLHRLRLLQIPGFSPQGKPRRASDTELRERWEIVRSEDLEAALIEAAAWGATLESAATARLEAALLAAEGQLVRLAALLGEAIFVGIELLAAETLAKVALAVGNEKNLTAIGLAGGELLGLFRHGELLGAHGAPALARVLEASADRGLFLLEGCHGENLPAEPAEITTLVVLRDLHRCDGLAVPRERGLAVFARVAADPAAPPCLRGGSLGASWSLGGLGENARAVATAALRAAARPQTCGDFLAGLLAVARTELVNDVALIEVLDEVVAGFGEDEFLIALPALRLAFGYFPPLEKEGLAARLLELHGSHPALARDLLRLAAPAELRAESRALEQRVLAAARRFGLLDPFDRDLPEAAP